MDKSEIERAVEALEQGQLIAYPTEAVFGIGCDPDNQAAIRDLLTLKQRPASKGLIIVASCYTQLLPYIAQVEPKLLDKALASWPGPVTWLFPVAERVEPLLVGEHKTIAVRVSAHPVVSELCEAYGKPITSTSANLSGRPPARTETEVRAQLGREIAVVVSGDVDLAARPSEIRDLQSNQVIRS